MSAALSMEMLGKDPIWDAVDRRGLANQLKPHGLVHRKCDRHDGAGMESKDHGFIPLSLCDASVCQ